MAKVKRSWIAARKEDKRDTNLDVKEPIGFTEFEVQAKIWTELNAIGLNARGEVKTAFAGRASVRFDIAVFNDGVLAGIIEVKKSSMNHKTSWEKQHLSG